MNSPSILIVGAGPTGLALALGLARRGTPFRLISRAKRPGEQSRAMAVHARTLEFYAQFGFADEVVAEGVEVATVHLRERAGDGAVREVTRFDFAGLGSRISPFPFVLSFPQDDHERLLLRRLEAAGGKVEWEAELTGLSQDDGATRVTISHGDGRVEAADFAYVCGCDGAHSQVRRSVGVGFPGGDYDQLFYVVDARIDRGFDPDMYVHLDADIVALMLPVRSSGLQRLIGLVPPDLGDRQDLTFEDIRGRIEPLLAVNVTDVSWFSTYRTHHRVADHFRVGRVFLLGDTGHVHSPAGGQGMNTGIGDAVNLGWKLAAVLDGRGAVSLLDSYEAERIGFARALVATTDRAFTSLVATGPGGELVGRFVAPMALTVVNRLAFARHIAFCTLSQTHIHYGDSPLSEGRAGHVRGGDRLPWLGPDGADNFASLRSLDWQTHVYGDLDPPFGAACKERRLRVHTFAWNDAARDAGFERNGAYLVRPDGHVALAQPSQSTGELLAYLDRWALHPLRPETTATGGGPQAGLRPAAGED